VTVPSGVRSPDFVQLGASRDGWDPYLDAAHRRSLRAVLVETPACLRWRRALGRREFDLELPVERPHEVSEVAAALARAGVSPGLVLTGFERYVYAGFALARRLRVAPWPGAGEDFAPSDKYRQRTALRRGAPRLPQPGFASLRADSASGAEGLSFPLVVKPVDGGGGLGVTLAGDAGELEKAVLLIREASNYGGGSFAGVIAEEFVDGPESSLQGVAHDGRPLLLSVCDKLTAREDATPASGVRGFREIGHVARHGDTAGDALLGLARSCIDALGYREGPFHIDVIHGASGPVVLETGFRLSGAGLAPLIEQATGADWADLAFRAHLGEQVPERLPASGTVAGQVSVTTDAELAAAERLAAAEEGVTLTRATPPADPAALHPGDRALLAADLERHTGSLGRVVVVGDRAERVRALLQSVVR
jgi:hypothetical protein